MRDEAPEWALPPKSTNTMAGSTTLGKASGQNDLLDDRLNYIEDLTSRTDTLTRRFSFLAQRLGAYLPEDEAVTGDSEILRRDLKSYLDRLSMSLHKLEAISNSLQ